MKKPYSCLLFLAVGWVPGCLLAGPPSGPEFELISRSDYYDLLRQAEKAIHDEKSTNAFELQQRLACAGNQLNQAALGGLYLTGRGVGRDDVTGYAWLKLAAASGEAKYQSLTKMLELGMTAEQRTIADAKVAKLTSLYAPIPTHMDCSQVQITGSHFKELRCEPESSGSNGRLVWLKRCVANP